MASKSINWQGIGVRFILALVLVMLTYNPGGTSYYHWFRDSMPNYTPLLVFAGVVLLIGWTVFLRATLQSLGFSGLVLSFAFFGSLLWLVVDYGIVPANSANTIGYIILVILSGILATGMSWSLIRRRLSGQVDTSIVDED